MKIQGLVYVSLVAVTSAFPRNSQQKVLKETSQPKVHFGRVGVNEFVNQVWHPAQMALSKDDLVRPLEFSVADSFDGDGVPYSGIASFGHLNYTNCFDRTSDGSYDVAIVGMPFDLGVTYRPGARFGPGAVRLASRRLFPEASWESVKQEPCS